MIDIQLPEVPLIISGTLFFRKQIKEGPKSYRYRAVSQRRSSPFGRNLQCKWRLGVPTL